MTRRNKIQETKDLIALWSQEAIERGWDAQTARRLAWTRWRFETGRLHEGKAPWATRS